MYRLIVNADDMGYSLDRDRGLTELLQARCISAVSLMTNGASSGSAAEWLRTHYDRPDHVAGLHLNLTEGRPLLEPTECRSLLDPACGEPTMRGKMGFRAALAAGDVQLSHVVAETRAQLHWFARALNVPHALHVDGHQHVHLLPAGVAEALAALFAREGIQTTRIAHEPALLHDDTTHAHYPWMRAADNLNFIRSVSENAQRCASVFAAAGIRSSSAFVGLALVGQRLTLARLLASLDHIIAVQDGALRGDDRSAGDAIAPLASIEYMCHPGYTAASGGDEFNRSPDREHELSILRDDELHAELRARGVRLARWTGEELTDKE